MISLRVALRRPPFIKSSRVKNAFVSPIFAAKEGL